MGAANGQHCVEDLLDGPHFHRKSLTPPNWWKRPDWRGWKRVSLPTGAVAWLPLTVRAHRPVTRDKFLVKDASPKAQVDWGKVNQPFPQDRSPPCWKRVERHCTSASLQCAISTPAPTLVPAAHPIVRNTPVQRVVKATLIPSSASGKLARNR